MSHVKDQLEPEAKSDPYSCCLLVTSLVTFAKTRDQKLPTTTPPSNHRGYEARKTQRATSYLSSVAYQKLYARKHVSL